LPQQNQEEAMPANDRDAKSDSGGFTQFLAALAVLISLGALGAVAFKLDNGSASSPAASAATAAAPTAETTPVEAVRVVIKSDEEEGRKGPDGKWHDAFLPADFSVKAGATVKVTVYNYDDMPHSFTAAGLGVNQMIPAGGGSTEEAPGKVTFTFKAPMKAGSYEWYCAVPCDPWAMAHDGFMRGKVTVS
jgi:plastocyanin